MIRRRVDHRAAPENCDWRHCENITQVVHNVGTGGVVAARARRVAGGERGAQHATRGSGSRSGGPGAAERPARACPAAPGERAEVLFVTAVPRNRIRYRPDGSCFASIRTRRPWSRSRRVAPGNRECANVGRVRSAQRGRRRARRLPVHGASGAVSAVPLCDCSPAAESRAIPRLSLTGESGNGRAAGCPLSPQRVPTGGVMGGPSGWVIGSWPATTIRRCRVPWISRNFRQAGIRAVGGLFARRADEWARRTGVGERAGSGERVGERRAGVARRTEGRRDGRRRPRVAAAPRGLALTRSIA